MDERQTLVPEYMARKGERFVYLGPSEPCRHCGVKNICLSQMEEGAEYRVEDVLEERYECALSEGEVVGVRVVRE